MNRHAHSLDFAQIGTIFNQVTTSMIGGIDAHNSRRVMNDLQTIQTTLEKLISDHPEKFQGEAGIHAQNIVDQVNLEMQAIRSIGTDPYAAKYINDVQRDLIDIVQGDDQLAALASRHGVSGFAGVPDLLVPPAPFHGNAEQTAFMKQFAADAVSLGDRAVALLDQGAVLNSPEAQKLIQDISDYVNNSNAFTVAQGGLYSARFNNEFALDGVNGTASRALIHALQTGDTAQGQAAASVLAANAADVAGNMLGIGDTPVPTGSGIPQHIDTFAEAGAVFNDATTKLIGGVYDGSQGDGNRQSIVNDLTATRDGLQGLLDAQPDDFNGRSAKDVQKMVALLGKEIDAVETAGTGPGDSVQINALHRAIVAIAQNDPALKAAATDGDVTGFSPLPQASGPALARHDFAPPPVVAHNSHGVGDHGGHGFGFEHFWG